MELLVASTILQWIVITFCVTFSLATLRLAGERHNAAHALDESALKGVNVANELLVDARSGAFLSLDRLLAAKPMMMLVIAPTCTDCDKFLRRLCDSEIDRHARYLVVVRAKAEVAHALAIDLPESITVVVDSRGLGLTGFRPPFATVLDAQGTFVGLQVLTNDQDLDRGESLLRVHESRAANIGSQTPVAMGPGPKPSHNA